MMNEYNTKDNFIHDSKSLGLRIAVLRERKQISARQLSYDIGRNKNYINSVESGKAYPSVPTLMSICKQLDISLKDFFDPEFRNNCSHINSDNMFSQLTPEQSFYLKNLIDDLIEKNKLSS